MTWEGPGFVDHHAHLLRVSAEDFPPYDLAKPASIAQYHRGLYARGTTPMDAAEPLDERRDLGGMLVRGLERAAAVGLVEVTEAGMTDWAYLDALVDRRERDILPVRVRIFAASGIADPARMKRLEDPWLEVVGVKLYADGWLGPRTCAVSEPFEDDPESAGLLFLDADALAHRVEPFAEAGWHVATHAIGDRAIEAVLDAYARVYDADCAAIGPRIEHAQVLRPDLVERMAEMGVVVCVQPGFAVSDAEPARAALGKQRASHAYRWESLLEAGVRVIAGSDFPVEPLAPLKGLERLVTGAAEGGPRVTEPLPLDLALSIMADARAGSTVLDADPHDVEPELIHRIEVLDIRPNTARSLVTYAASRGISHQRKTRPT